jgi:hypothetical protein
MSKYWRNCSERHIVGLGIDIVRFFVMMIYRSRIMPTCYSYDVKVQR